ncbi:carboxypeptidase B-like isoform X2 [Palaemon carinicauda]
MQLCSTGLLAFLVILPHFCWSQYAAPPGDQIWEVEGEIGLVTTMLQDKGLVDILDESRSRKIIRVGLKNSIDVKFILLQHKLTYKILVKDLASYLKEKDGKTIKTRSITCTDLSCPQPLSDAYMTLDQIEWYLKELNISHSSRVNVTSIGKSIEGRDIWLVHIRPLKCRVDGAVWIEAGIHAREWIAPAVILQLIPKLLEDCSRIGYLDIFIVPMANPDGYLYSWTTNRLWRKNRRINNNTSQVGCDGVDLNRNWDYKFGLFASSNPCSETFHGASGFSEPETKALSDAMIAVSRDYNLLMVMAFHSYGQFILHPWGWSTEEAPDTPMMISRATLWANATKKRYGTVYKVTSTTVGLYAASGATDDWAKAVLQVKYSYTVELRDEGTEGFVLSPNQIVPSSEEVWDGMKILLTAVGPGDYIYL